MRLREITSPNKSVSFALGRLNPATTGHGLLVEAVRQGPGDAIQTAQQNFQQIR